VLLEGRYPADEEIFALLDEYDVAYRTYLQRRGAEPQAWTTAMASTFARPRRGGIADYYQGKGADLS